MTDSDDASTELEVGGATGRAPLRERWWAFAAHLTALPGLPILYGGNILGPLIVWQLNKNEMPFVESQGKEALNFQITMAFAILVTFWATVYGLGLLFGLWPLYLLVLGTVVLSIWAAIAALRGRTYRYPVTLRFIR